MATVHNGLTRDDVRKSVRDFVVPLAGLPDLDDHQPLLSEHLLDSLAAVQMVDFVERSFGVEIEDAELEIANFDTMAGLIGLIVRKLDAGGPGGR